MKVGVVGKGGVGKTTVAALIAATLARRGRRVVAVDTDSNPNLGLSLGLDLATTEAVPVLPRSLVVGRGGDVTPDELIGSYGQDTPAGVTLLSALRVTDAAAGCTCGGHATVHSFLEQSLDDHADVTVVDMEAGLEHLSRSGGTLAAADVLVAVIEPSRKAVVTAARTRDLARDLGIPRVVAVGNKLLGDEDRNFLEEACAAENLLLLGALPYASEVRQSDRDGAWTDGEAPVPEVADEIDRIVDRLTATPVA